MYEMQDIKNKAQAIVNENNDNIEGVLALIQDLVTLGLKLRESQTHPNADDERSLRQFRFNPTSDSYFKHVSTKASIAYIDGSWWLNTADDEIKAASVMELLFKFKRMEDNGEL